VYIRKKYGQFRDESRINQRLGAEKNQLFPSSGGILEIIILPAFNRYFYATHKKYYKKSISPILQSIKNFQSAKIVTLDGFIIGNESMLENVI